MPPYANPEKDRTATLVVGSVPLSRDYRPVTSQHVSAERRTFAKGCCEVLWRAIQISFPVGSWKPLLDKRPRGRWLHALRGLEHLWTWVCSMVYTRGEIFAAKAIKDSLNAFRVHALSGVVASGSIINRFLQGSLSLEGLHGLTRQTAEMQLSRASRALPRAPESFAKKQLEAHKKNLTSSFSCSAEDLDSIRCFTKELFARLRARGTDVRSDVRVGLSSCMEMPRSGGGQLGYLRNQAELVRAEEVTRDTLNSYVPLSFQTDFAPVTGRSLELFDELRSDTLRRDVVMYTWQPRYAEVNGLTPEDWEVVREVLFLKEAIFASQPTVVETEAVPVYERGTKVRIVTKAPGAWVAALQLWNTRLLDLLSREPATRDALQDCDQRSRFVDLVNGFPQKGSYYEKGWTFRSADLTAATDLMPRDLCLAIGGGILEGLDETDATARSLLLDACGDIACKWPTGASVTSRGILMGLPPSWPMLCVYNMWMHHTAWEETVGLPSSFRWGKKLYRVIGDDYVAFLPVSVSQRYTDVLLRTGGKPSHGKDLESPNGLVFGEEGAVWTLGELRSLRTVSVRTLIGEAEWTRGGVDILDVPPMLASAFERSSPCQRERIHEIVRTQFRSLIERMSRCGIPPFIPREFGGGGFPSIRPNREFRLEKKFTRALRILLSSWIQDKSSGFSFSKLSSAWTTSALGQSSVWAWEDLEKQVREYGVTTIERDPNSLSMSDAHARLVAVLRISEQLSEGVASVDKERLNLSSIGKRIRTLVTRTNASVPGNRLSDKTSVLADGLKRMRKEYEDNFRVSSVLGAQMFAPVWQVGSASGVV